MKQAVLVLTTLDSRAAAEQFARSLVEGRMAACVSIVGPMRSIYRWEGVIEENDEFLLLIKRPAEDLDAFEANVRALHPYDTPEILFFRADHAGTGYLAWLLASTQPSNTASHP